MKLVRRLYIAAAIAAVLGAASLSPASAQNIVTVTGPSNAFDGTYGPGNQEVATSWTQTSSYSNVLITALLTDTGSADTGTAYLTTSLGTGANIIDSAPFVFPDDGTVNTTLFSGLSLAGHQTYYLVLAANGQPNNAGWAATLSPTITTGPGVTHDGDLFADDYTPIPPDSTFVPSGFNSTLIYSVVSVPEPRTLAVMGLGLLSLSSLIVLARRRKPSQA